MLKLIYSGAMIVLMAACAEKVPERTNGYSDTPKNSGDSLFQEVMDGHDVAMAKMGKLAGYRKQVEQKIDSIGKLPGARASADTLKELSANLKKAEEEMNTWMHEFSLDSADAENPNRIPYLETEKIKVNKVRDQILSTLAVGDSLLLK